MRLAVVSDIHANLTALEAVTVDLYTVSPDLVIHGGDLVGSGAHPAELVDRIRELGWAGVYGNSDEMVWTPARVSEIDPRAAYAVIDGEHVTIRRVEYDVEREARALVASECPDARTLTLASTS